MPRELAPFGCHSEGIVFLFLHQMQIIGREELSARGGRCIYGKEEAG